MDEKKKILIGALKQKIKELIRKEMEEGTGTSGIAGAMTPYAFAKSGKGNERAATAATGYEMVKEEGKDQGKKKAAPAPKPKVVAVGQEKTPDVVKDPNKPGITKADAAVLARRQNVASSLGHKDDARHYAKLLALANKELKK
jgi:hypothetical protein